MYSRASSRVGLRVEHRVGGVDAVDLRALQQGLGVDLEGALGRARVGGEVRHAEPGGEDDDAALLEVTDGAQRHERLGDLRHRDRRLHPRGHVDLLQGILQRQRVHDRGEHAHVVGAVAVDARRLPAAPDVAAAHDDRGLDAEVDDLGQLTRDQRGRVVGDAGAGGRRERLAGELSRTRWYVGRASPSSIRVRDPSAGGRYGPAAWSCQLTPRPRPAGTGRTAAPAPSRRSSRRRLVE